MHKISVLIGRKFNTGNYTSLNIQLGWEGEVPGRNVHGAHESIAEDLEKRIQKIYNKIQGDDTR
jgi:hypothetical protein